jgi:uncharacterized protein
MEEIMTPEERQLLEALAQRVKSVPAQAKDFEADQAIRQLVNEREDTAYILAQTVIMQDFALRNAQSQIEDLQRKLTEAPGRQQSGSFLGGLFGGTGTAASPSPRPWGQAAEAQQSQQITPTVMQPSQTGDFLRSAANTAVGVAGGALLFQGINSLFSHHGGSGSFLGSGSAPPESLSETTIVNNYYDSPGEDEQNSDPSRGVEEASDDNYDDGPGDDSGDDSEWT